MSLADDGRSWSVLIGSVVVMVVVVVVVVKP